jgi:hypothetical protein
MDTSGISVVSGSTGGLTHYRRKLFSSGEKAANPLRCPESTVPNDQHMAGLASGRKPTYRSPADPSQAVRLFQIFAEMASFCLAFLGHPSDESSCANEAQKGFTTMTNAEAIITENAATVAEQGAHVAPEKASSKKLCHQKEGRAQGPEKRQGRQSQGLAEEGSQGR